MSNKLRLNPNHLKTVPAALLLAMGSYGLSGCDTSEIPTCSVTVQDDDTLWSIGSEVDPSRTGEVVTELKEINTGVDESNLSADDELALSEESCAKLKENDSRTHKIHVIN